MLIGGQEWQQLQAERPPAIALAAAPSPPASLYQRLSDGTPDAATREEAAQFLRDEIRAQAGLAGDLPARPDGLLDWMEANTRSVHTRYAAYLEKRKAGAPRR